MAKDRTKKELMNDAVYPPHSASQLAGSRYQVFQIIPSFILCIVFLSLLVFGISCTDKERGSSGAATGQGGEKVTIGEVEEVMLLSWSEKLPARIDTGATSTSLDARNLKIKDNFVEFKLRNGKKVKLPVLEYRYIRTSVGRELRPVVMLDLCLGSLHLLTEVTLTDRSHLKYPLLVGRRVLKGNFVVDVSRKNTTLPSCPELRFK